MNKIFISTTLETLYSFEMGISLAENLEKNGFIILNNETKVDLTSSLRYLINSADLIIAILKENDLQVIFEIGYALSAGKNIIIISDNEDQIPSFLKHISFIKTNSFNQKILNQIISSIERNINGKSDDNLPKNIEDLISQFKNDHQIIEKISEKEFVVFIETFFKEKMKCVVKNSRGKNDFGYDLELHDCLGKRKTLIELKKYGINSKVSLNIVQQIVGAMSLYNADSGIIITSSDFTESAKNFAKSIGYDIELWNLFDIEKLLSKK